MTKEVTQEMFDKEYALIKIDEKITKAKNYLRDTDFYYARLSEIGESIPEDVATKRIEYREFIRDNK